MKAPTKQAMARALINLQNQTRGGISGQAFTEYMCVLCQMLHMHPNTSCPLLCPNCEKKIRWVAAGSPKPASASTEQSGTEER